MNEFELLIHLEVLHQCSLIVFNVFYDKPDGDKAFREMCMKALNYEICLRASYGIPPCDTVRIVTNRMLARYERAKGRAA